MKSNEEKADELATALISSRSFLDIYPTVERLFYGMDSVALVGLMKATMSRMKVALGTETQLIDNAELYDSSFYDWVRLGSQRSAKVVVPLLIEAIRPHSVVDVGCGDGMWLAEFLECGVERVQGLDGQWVNKNKLAIPEDLFRAIDIRAFRPQKDERFDLVLSVECAEHIESDYAASFVQTLCSFGHFVCFSAAVPFQGGVGHVNEQWPEYWAQLFESNGYRTVDFVRPKIWANPEVESWYAQNILLFADQIALKQNRELAECHRWTDRTTI